MPPFLRSLILKNRGLVTECLRRRSSLTYQNNLEAPPGGAMLLRPMQKGGSTLHITLSLACFIRRILPLTTLELETVDEVTTVAELFENMDKKATWDRFYAETNRDRKDFENFDWFFGFSSVRDIILPLLQANTPSHQLLHVLDLGCGTSALGPSIYRHCPLPVHVTCADISPVAVQLMQAHAQASTAEPLSPSSQLEFIELDCTRLHQHYRPSSVDLIVDKGTIDALLRSRDGKDKAGLMLRQCLGALRRSGSMVQFSDEDPDARLLWLETEAQERGVMLADIGVQDVAETYYCYHLSPRSVIEQR